MNKEDCYNLIPIIIFLLSPLFCSASVVFNEIAWMGREESHSHEWIELYNQNEEMINLQGWKIIAEDGTPEIELEGEIKDFFILERTDDETLPEIKADLIYSGALENSGENLKLINNKGKVVDQVDGWQAGDNETKRTMERVGENLWQNSFQAGGSPGKENLMVKKLYPGNILINEIMPSPRGLDEKKEWLELFNNNDFEVELFNWKIRDGFGTPGIYVFPEESKIAAKDFLVLKRKESGIKLQNSRDELILINPNGKFVYQIAYQNAPLGKSFNRGENSWYWSEKASPGTENVTSKKATSTKEVSESKEKTKAEDPKRKNNLLLALIIAFLSALAVIIIKKIYD